MKQALQLGIISSANIVINFLFQWYILTQLGPGSETDALFAGMTLPQLVLVVISSSLMHVLVPLLAGEEKERLRHDSWGFLILISVLFSSIAGLLYVTAPWWIPLTVPGFNPSAQLLTTQLTRIQLIGMVFAAMNGVQWAAYHARQQFIRAEITPLLSSVVGLLLLMWALPLYGVVAAAWISTLRLGVQTLLLAPGMGMPLWPDFKSPAIKKAWQRIKPLMLGNVYYKTDPLVDRFLLSSSASGGLSLYYLAQQIYGAASQVINKATAAPLVPVLAKYHKEGDVARFWDLYNRKIMQIAIMGVGAICLLALIGKPCLHLLVGHGNVKENDILLLWLIMILMSGQFIIGNIGVIMTSMFYSRGDTRTPTLSGSIAYSLGIPIKLCMFYGYGIKGLAVAVSLYYLVSLFLLVRQVKRTRNEDLQKNN